jgi:hypothetical protein
MKKLSNRKYTILLALVTSICSANFISDEVLVEEAIVYEKNNSVVIETFEITEVKNGEVRGELLTSTEGSTGEGIYLDETYKEYESIKNWIKVGDVIKVDYEKKDYENEVWDNILDIEIISEK